MKFLLFGNNNIEGKPLTKGVLDMSKEVEVKDVVEWNGSKCTVEVASPLHGYRKLDNYEVIITDLQSTVSKSSGKDMYVMTVYVVLAYDEEEKTLVCDKRRLYKAGAYQMQEVRDALTACVADEIAKSGEKILFLTDEVLESTLRGKQAVISADIVRGSNGQLNITLLF